MAHRTCARALAWMSIPLLSCSLAGGAALAREGDPRVRILQLEDERASTAELHALLGSGDAALRARAALAVGRIGRPEDVPRLAPLLEDSDASVRRSAAFALGEIEDSTAARALAAWLDRSPGDAEARASAVEGLGKLRAEASACARALSDRSPLVVAAALGSAWQIPVTDRLARVIELSSASDEELRFRAAYCLMRFLGSPASGRTPIAGGVVLSDAERRSAGERLRILVADSSPRVRMQAARGLRAFVDTLATRSLANLARDADWRVRVEAVRSLAAANAAGERREISLDLLRPFLRDENPNVRVTVAEALATAGGPASAISELEQLTRDPRARIRQVAHESLFARAEAAELTGPTTQDVERWIAALIASPDWSLRATAVRGIDLLPDSRALELLDPLTRDEPRVAKETVEPWVRRQVRSTDRASIQPLALHRDPVMRALLLGSLQAAVTDTALPTTAVVYDSIAALARRMSGISRRLDADNDVRMAVLDLAEALEGRPAFRALARDALDDPDYVVRRRAVQILRGCGETPAREAEPVGAALGAEEAATILDWADREHWALFETEGGTLVARLFSREAPLTCWNFARLAGRGAYDRGVWHRVVPDFVFQDGCPRGDGYGGPGWSIRCEIHPARFRPGALGMALSGKDTGGSQFFFTHSDQPHLDGRYTVFGQLERGEELAALLVQGAPIFSVRVVDERP